MIEYDVSPETSPVREAVRGLVQISRFLRWIGLCVAASTLALVGGVLLAMARLLAVYPREVLPWAVGLAFTNIILVIAHEAQRRRGDAVFEEISDELQWHLARANRESAPAVSDRPKPELEARLALREYVKATDLPLLPGTVGSAWYIGVNVATIATFIWTTYIQ